MTNHHADKLGMVQDFLRTHSLDQLAHKHGVYARVEGYKFSLNYDQIETKDGDRLAEGCRGLILRTADGRVPSKSEVVGETVCLARPMDRFYNFGQGGASKVDFEDPETMYFEKLDGTLIILYFDDIKKDWCVATRSVPEANLPIDGYSNYDFRKLFIEAFEKTSGFSWMHFTEIVLPAHLGRTFCFELLTPFNQIVVQHEKMKVVLLTARNNKTGIEDSRTVLEGLAEKDFNVPVTPCFQFDSAEKLIEFVNARPGREYEGIVVCDKNHRRLKVKSLAYVASSRAKDLGGRPRNLLELILNEQIDDVLTLLTEPQQKMVADMREALRLWIVRYDEAFDDCMASVKVMGVMSEKVTRKQFVNAVQSRPDMMLDPAMSRMDGKCEGVVGWIHNKKNKDGSYPDTFLNKLLTQIGFGVER
jgi:hypothetical protein